MISLNLRMIFRTRLEEGADPTDLESTKSSKTLISAPLVFEVETETSLSFRDGTAEAMSESDKSYKSDA